MCDRREAKKARDLVVSERRRRTEQIETVKARGRNSALGSPISYREEEKVVTEDGRVEVLSKLLELKTTEAAKAHAELTLLRGQHTERSLMHIFLFDLI